MAGEAPRDPHNLKITKSELEYNVKSLRFLLLTVTVIFLVLAFLMIVMGLSVYSYFHGFNAFLEGGKMFTPSVMMVLLGMSLVIVFSIGFIGSLKYSTCLVNIYASVLVVLLFLKFIMVILAFTVNNSTLMSYINVPVDLYATDLEIEKEINYLQTALNCCGSENFMDYVGIPFADNHSTATITTTDTNDNQVTTLVPQSCCTRVEDSYCVSVRSHGCQNALFNFVVQNASVLGVLGVSVMFIQILGIIFALLLARGIRRLKSQNALISWKLKEADIMAREASKQQNEKSESVYIDHTPSSNA